MNRRGFLQSCIALAAAPAIVRADSLMRIVQRELSIIVPTAAPISSLAGCIRVIGAYDLLTDGVLIRLDTFNGEKQYHVDTRLTAEMAANWREHIGPAREVLEAHVKHHHGGFNGFKAPPLHVCGDWSETL